MPDNFSDGSLPSSNYGNQMHGYHDNSHSNDQPEQGWDSVDAPKPAGFRGPEPHGKPESNNNNIGYHSGGGGVRKSDPAYDGAVVTTPTATPRTSSRTTPRYTDDSSYSALEDNEALTGKKIRDDIPDSDLIDYEDDGGDSLIDSVPDMEYEDDAGMDDSRVRIFIALFDYDPSIMSPNPDAMDEELPFKEGQLIKVGGVEFFFFFFLVAPPHGVNCLSVFNSRCHVTNGQVTNVPLRKPIGFHHLCDKRPPLLLASCKTM